MERYFIRLLIFLIVTYCLALQMAEATDGNASETIELNKTDRVGLGFTSNLYSGNRGMMGSGGFSWKIWTSRKFDLQGLFLTDWKTNVWAGNRFLYTSQIKSLGKLYVGWGMNYPILQVETNSTEETPEGPWIEALLGLEYFFPNHPDLGYSIEVGLNPLKLKGKTGIRLLLAYHHYI